MHWWPQVHDFRRLGGIVGESIVMAASAAFDGDQAPDPIITP